MSEADVADIRSFLVKDLVFNPTFRTYCEENRCGRYGNDPMCPPACGTVAEMQARASAYTHGIVYRTHLAREAHNRQYAAWLAAEIAAGRLPAEGLTMSTGPTATASCISAYCADATALMKTVGLPFSWQPGEESCVNVYLY